MPGSQSILCRFVNRERELELLDRAYRKRPGFAVIYGRRRIGKTRLITEWIRLRGVRAVYFMAASPATSITCG